MKKINVYAVFGFISLLIFLSGCQTENKTARQKFMSGKAAILVCPIHILDNQSSFFDPLLSQKIVDYLNDKKYGVASITQLTPPANNEWRHNEAKILTVSIDLFIEFVKKNNFPEDTYILYPEFLKAGANSAVVAVHYCLLSNKGEIVMRGLLNSHWEEFKKVNPKSDNDCVAVFINGFEEKMKTKS